MNQQRLENKVSLVIIILPKYDLGNNTMRPRRRKRKGLTGKSVEIQDVYF